MKSDLPAFPTWNVVDITKGMSLRDYFATAAMQGIVYDSNVNLGYKTTAAWAYSMADAMMEARK